MTTAEPTPRGAAARRAARGGEVSSSSTSTSSAVSAGEGDAGAAAARSPSARRQLDPDALAALEEERDFLLRSLDDLDREHDAGDVDDTDYAELKDDYTARAANVLRALDDRRAAAAANAPSRSWVRTAVGLGVVAVLALGVGWFAFRDAGTRAPGGGITGDARQDSANRAMEAQQLTGLAQQALREGDSEGALELYRQAMQSYSEALELSPSNAEALTNRGWLYHNLALAVGEGSEAVELEGFALEDLDQAIAAEPTYAPARVFRAVLAANAGQYAAAQDDLDAADPADIPTYMASTVDDLKERIAAGFAGTPSSTVTP
jgi:tetratricopeptide (TPR) repeat protein